MPARARIAFRYGQWALRALDRLGQARSLAAEDSRDQGRDGVKVVRDKTGRDYVFTAEGELVVGNCRITIEIDPHGDAVTNVEVTLPNGAVFDYVPYEVIDYKIDPAEVPHFDPRKETPPD